MPRRRYFIFLYCAAIALCAELAGTVRADSLTVTTVDGRKLSGELTLWQPNRVEITADGKPAAFKPAELLGVRFDKRSANRQIAPPFAELADGSRLPITEITVKDRTALVSTPLAAESLEIPAEQIRLVQLVPAEESSLSFEGAIGDCVAVIKKDSPAPEVLTGTIKTVTAEQVEFTWEGETIPVKRSKIAAIGFFQKESGATTPPLCVVSLASGAQFVAQQVELKDNVLQILTAGGLTIEVPAADLVAADYSLGKLTYLSDVRPLKSDWTPLVEPPAAAESLKDFGKPRMNISFTGSPLALTWPGKNGTSNRLQTYDKGIAARSRTELEYRLPKGMRRFVAIAGIDPDTASQGHVELRIEADGVSLFDQEIVGTAAPVEIDADVTGKQKLRIFVDYGENLDLGDRLHLVEARLVK